jgi:tetratricopeptide (TPR) repeat protein
MPVQRYYGNLPRLNVCKPFVDKINNNIDIETSQPRAKYFMVPSWCEKNPHFTGRNELIKTLTKMLWSDDPQKHKHRVALHGLGGVGKTQTAIEYVVTQRSKYDSIFWITAADSSGLLLGFQEIAKLTGCASPIDGGDSREVATQVIRWLGDQARWLLVLDNLDDVEVVKHSLPDTINGGHTLITTRNPFTLSIPAQGLEVPVLDDGSATELLLERAEIDYDDESVLAASRVVKELGSLPLAIDQAAAYIREQLNRDISQFMTIYARHRKQFLNKIPGGNWDYHSENRYRVVATTWRLCLDAVEDRSKDAAQLLRLFAFMNPDGILLEFLKAGTSSLPVVLQELIQNSFAFNDALRDLQMFSLIQRPLGGHVIRIHRLVQTVIKDELDDNERRQYKETFINLGLAAFPKFNFDNRSVCRRFQEQVIRPLEYVFDIQTDACADLCLRVSRFLMEDGKYNDSAWLLEEEVKIRAALRGADDRSTLMSMGYLADTYRKQGRFTEAAKMEEEVLAKCKVILGEDHPATLTSMHNLALTYQNQGKLTDAAKMGEEVLAKCEVILGEDHPDTLTSMHNLALTYRKQGKLTDAAKMNEEVFAKLKVILGEDHPDTLTSMHNLALTYQNQGKLTDAAKMYEEVLAKTKLILGNDHPYTLTSMHGLVKTYQQQGKFAETAKVNET